MSSVWVKDAGVWRSTSDDATIVRNLFVKDAGVWRFVSASGAGDREYRVFVKDAGVWRQTAANV